LTSPAQQSLKNTLQKNVAKTFQVAADAEDAENVSPTRGAGLRSPIAGSLFAQSLGHDKENKESPIRTAARLDGAADRPESPLALWSPQHSSQDTVADSEDSDPVFSQDTFQSTQPTQATASFRRSLLLSQEERRDTAGSFVSAKEALGSKNASYDSSRNDYEDHVMEVDSEELHAAISHPEASPVRDAIDDNDQSMSDAPPKRISEAYSISAETHEVLDTANTRALLPEPKNFIGTLLDASTSGDTSSQIEGTIVHHDVEDEMEIDDEEVRSPSDKSSPVKAPIRKSSLTFASLPAREPLIAKKSMGNRVSRTSHVDSSKSRITNGKSLGSQHTQIAESNDDDMDVDVERPQMTREESETTKLHNSTSTKSLKERLEMLNQRIEPPKRISQTVIASQTSQALTSAPSQPVQSSQHSQPTYPSLFAGQQEIEDEDDDWISPIRAPAPAPQLARPAMAKSYSAQTQPKVSKQATVPKPISVSNPDLPAVEESTTPVGSPAGKKHTDGPLSASKAKLYSAFRAAKEKIIGSSATSAQAKLDALFESPMRSPIRPNLQAHGSSSDDVFNSPKRNEKTGASIFSHLRSPSKESIKTMKSTKSTKTATMPSSPLKSSSSPSKEDGRRTRSSSERERLRERETREKETKQQQRAEERLKDMREKEQSKAAAHYQKTKAAAKTPSAASSQSSIKSVPTTTAKPPTSQGQLSRPGTARMNTAPKQQDPEPADEMAPPPPPKSLLPTGTGQKLREPKRLAKAPSKELPKGKPQKIQVNLHRFGQPPAPPPKSAPATVSKSAAPQAPKIAAAPVPPPKQAPVVNTKPAPAPKNMAPPPKPAAKVGRPPTAQGSRLVEKPKAAPAPPRADLGASRPLSRLQTVQDATRINVPPVNPAKPPAKRPFQPENDEHLHRPAKRPSQQAKSIPATPAHNQFAHGKIPFAEPAQPAIQYQNGEEIKLPDIMTDSEDEDSENEFEQPDWVNTPNLRELLQEQQLADPEAIFGPIAPLNMEQMFPNKERHKRFRERTSSAYWSNDQVTEEERRKEREARERLVREGAWTYNPSPRPGPSKQ
jgi:hypothetical protein